MTLIYILYSLICLVLIAIDYVVKMQVFDHLKGLPSIPVIEGILHFKYCENTGAAFSLFTGKADILGIVSTVVLVAFVVGLIIEKPKSNLLLSAMTLLIAGGTGNVIDRFMRGIVVDFIELPFITFPIFNVADIYVCTGAGLLILYIITRYGKVENK